MIYENQCVILENYNFHQEKLFWKFYQADIYEAREHVFIRAWESLLKLIRAWITEEFVINQ